MGARYEDTQVAGTWPKNSRQPLLEDQSGRVLRGSCTSRFTMTQPLRFPRQIAVIRELETSSAVKWNTARGVPRSTRPP